MYTRTIPVYLHNLLSLFVFFPPKLSHNPYQASFHIWEPSDQNSSIVFLEFLYFHKAFPQQITDEV